MNDNIIAQQMTMAVDLPSRMIKTLNYPCLKSQEIVADPDKKGRMREPINGVATVYYVYQIDHWSY